MKIGYPGKGELPSLGAVCEITVSSNDVLNETRIGLAQWSGRRWVTTRAFRIGKGKVTKWRVL